MQCQCDAIKLIGRETHEIIEQSTNIQTHVLAPYLFGLPSHGTLHADYNLKYHCIFFSDVRPIRWSAFTGKHQTK